MRKLNWAEVEESSPYQRPPAGGYVARIVDVEDVPAREYLNVVYDIAEGEWAGFYSDEFGRRNPWAHRFVRSYKESAHGMFKAFLSRVEESNPGFTVSEWQRRSDERELVGLEVGIVLQYEDYTSDRGEDRDRLQVVDVYAAQDIRSGDFKVPPRRDSRRRAPGAEAPARPGAPAPEGPVARQAAFGERPPLSAYGDVPF